MYMHVCMDACIYGCCLAYKNIKYIYVHNLIIVQDLGELVIHVDYLKKNIKAFKCTNTN